MKQESIAQQGVISLEEPYRMTDEGISYKEAPALIVNDMINRKSLYEIVKALNTAYRRGFTEGQIALEKILK
jgi:hypothetical protein